MVFGVIEDLRRRGYNQSEIADMHGVSRQAVSWHKMTYGGHLTTRQMVNKAWPWKTTNLHGKSTVYQRLRDHGEYIATRGRGMSEGKLKLLESWWRKLREGNLVVEFDPNFPPEKGVSPYGGFAYRERIPEDGDLIIRMNEFTNLSEEGAKIWRWPSDELD
ncbi:Repressor-like immunity protein [Mycobacterium sp. ENV421]|nr:Repressor-like immunity protein [Mycobacterium sp. ENV421]